MEQSAQPNRTIGQAIMNARADEFFTKGWTRFGHDPRIAAWAEHALSAARSAVQDPANSTLLRCGGTWFVGLNALPNDQRGRLHDGPPLEGNVIGFVETVLGCADLPLHRAQLSICYPGYPRHGPEESEKAHRFRVEHDAAHVDGLLPIGPKRRRFLREPHAYVLGLPLAVGDRGAAPPVVWEGSHHLMRATFERCLSGQAVESWETVDVTAQYQQTRRAVFGSCQRVLVDALPGEAFLMHRHVLHGVAPWEEGARSSPDGRIIAYFRPRLGNIGDWLGAVPRVPVAPLTAP